MASRSSGFRYIHIGFDQITDTTIFPFIFSFIVYPLRQHVKSQQGFPLLLLRAHHAAVEPAFGRELWQRVLCVPASRTCAQQQLRKDCYTQLQKQSAYNI